MNFKRIAMMKYMFTLLALLMISSVVAQKEHRIQITVEDDRTLAPLSGLQVLIDSDKTLAETPYTNENGSVNFTWSGRLKYLRISVYDTSGNYGSQTTYIDKKVLKGLDIQHTFRLRKTGDYSTLFADFRAFDDQLLKENLAKGIDTTVYNRNMGQCDKLEEASFVGGEEALRTFIMNTLRYPQESIEMGEQGRVYTSFIVEADGTVANVYIERGVSHALDYEAARVIYAMPKWAPGKCNGEAVRTIYRLPLTYRLM